MKKMMFFLLLITFSQIGFASVGVAPNERTKMIMLSRFDKVKTVLSDVTLKTGFDMGTLTAIASIESGLNPTIKNKEPGASATGMFQHTKRTWNAKLALHHEDVGLPLNASRTDLKASALITIATLKKTEQLLIEKSHLTPKTIKTGDLYMSHFLGENGALKVINAKSNTPMSSIVSIHNGNRSLFYKKNGEVRTAREFRNYMDFLVNNEKQFYAKAIQSYQVERAFKPIAAKIQDLESNFSVLSNLLPKDKLIKIIS